MRGIAAYKSVRKQSATPERLLMMLYERAIQDQEDAIEFLQAGEVRDAMPLLQRTREIFVELMSALDPEQAPELTANLRRLYLWAVRELIRAGRDGDPEPVKATLEMTQGLHSAWIQAVAA
jgi:flagellar protein FliS